MRVLVYGFGPYKDFKTNITQKIIRKLPRSANVKKIVFPVRFDKAQFIAAVEKHRPNVILGLGQCGSGKDLRIERRAVNRRRDSKEEQGRPIRRGAATSLGTTLKLDGLGKQAHTSGSAGDYVCNFSMYVMLDYLRRYGKKARYGFIHIPHNYPFDRAFRLVRRVIGIACRT